MQMSEFRQRREQLLAALQPNSLVVTAAANEVVRSNDTHYPFRQDSDFHYLTGFPEPEAWLLLSNSDEHDWSSILFCREKDPQAEIWHGRRFGPDVAADQFELEEAYPLSDLEEALPALMEGHEQVYIAQGANADVDELVVEAMATLRDAPKQSRDAPQALVELRPFLADMRLRKSDAEIALMQQAADISVEAHKRAMRFCRPGAFEYQLAAEIHHEFTMAGCSGPAYGTIVGGGDNACILHYTENQDALNDGELVLIDAGGEYQGYAADITRTFPVSGRFSEPQKQLYQLVLDAQHAAMALLKPGNTLGQAADKAIEVITAGLLELGILQGNLADNIEAKTYRDYYMHGLGHWLGLDVHDVGRYKHLGEDIPLQPGMVMTVEPGIYIAKGSNVAEQWQGIGIRIEDNVLITEQGHRVLTADMPKNIADIEALMAQGR